MKDVKFILLNENKEIADKFSLHPEYKKYAHASDSFLISMNEMADMTEKMLLAFTSGGLPRMSEAVAVHNKLSLHLSVMKGIFEDNKSAMDKIKSIENIQDSIYAGLKATAVDNGGTITDPEFN